MSHFDNLAFSILHELWERDQLRLKLRVVKDVDAAKGSALVLTDRLLHLKRKGIAGLDSGEDSHVALQVYDLLLLNFTNLLVAKQIGLHVKVVTLHGSNLLLEGLVLALMLFV